MRGLCLAHHNNCPRCPIIGAEDIPGEEFFEFRSLRFNLQIARKLATPAMLHRVYPASLASWLEHIYIDQRHIDHLPAELGAGLMVTFPAELGRPLIDGNHQAARALRDGIEFVVHLLPEAETSCCFARAWARMSPITGGSGWPPLNLTSTTPLKETYNEHPQS